MRLSHSFGRAATIAGMALYLSLGVPAVAQDAPPPPAGASPPGNAAANKAAPSNIEPGKPTQGKILYTVPEDGMGAPDVPSDSRLVRDLVSKHPSEDVIICLAGCRTSVDRVVYSQPAEEKPKPATVSDSGPQAPVQPTIKNGEMKPAAASPAIDTKAPAAKTSEAKPQPAPPVPSASVDVKPVGADAKSHEMTPAAAEPKASVAATDAKPAAAAPAEAGAKHELVPTMAEPKPPVPAIEAKPAAAPQIEAPAASAAPSLPGEAAPKAN